jgi:transcriptional regulator with XRE-family HTH domain
MARSLPAPLSRFGLAFQVVRELQNMSQEQVGELMGLRKQQVGRYENNKQIPPMEKLVAFLKKVELAPSQFFFLVEVLERLARQVKEGAAQIPLWEGIPQAPEEVRELDSAARVVRVLYVTDRGDLCLLDDPGINDSLTNSLRLHRPKPEAVLSLNPSSPASRRPK